MVSTALLGGKKVKVSGPRNIFLSFSDRKNSEKNKLTGKSNGRDGCTRGKEEILLLKRETSYQGGNYTLEGVLQVPKKTNLLWP